MESMDSSLVEIDSLIRSLSTADYKTSTITPREESLMKGNRESYVKKIDKFLAEVDLPGLDYKKIKHFCEDFKEKLDEVAASTTRNYYLLKNFFPDLMPSIASSFKHLEKSYKKLSETIEQQEVNEINALHFKIHELNEFIIKSGALNKNQMALENELNETEVKLTIAKDKLKNLKISKEYKEFITLRKEESGFAAKVGKELDYLTSTLSYLKRPIRKYVKEQGSVLLEDYESNAPKSLIDDDNLKILEHIAKLSMMIDDGSLAVKSKKKAHAMLEKITKDRLEKSRKFLDDLEQDLRSIRDSLDKSPVSMNLSEYEYQIEHFEKKIKDLHEAREEALRKVSALGIAKKKADLEKRLLDVTGKEVNILIDKE